MLPSEQMCIDYGDDYFSERQYRCGKKKSKYLNVVNHVSSVAGSRPKKRRLKSATPSLTLEESKERSLHARTGDTYNEE